MTDPLSQRRQWLSFFPEGSLEFLVVTRVLAIVLLSTLIIIPTNQRPMVLVALCGTLWLDYALTMWWLLEVSTELEGIRNPSLLIAGPMYMVRQAALALLPATLTILAFALWARGSRSTLIWAVTAAAVVAGLATIPIALRVLRSAYLGSSAWLIVLLIPVAHWFSLHRLLPALHGRVRQRAIDQGLPVSSETGAGSAVTAADIFLVLGVIFGFLWSVLLIRRTDLGFKGGAAAAATISMACFFSITDVAAVEYLQRRFVALMRRSTAGRASGG